MVRNPDATGPRHPLFLAGFSSDDGKWTASGCTVELYWNREIMDWIASVQLSSGRQVRTRFRWLRLNVEEEAR